MLLRRFDTDRLRAVPPEAVSARSCPRTEDLVAACLRGAGPANRAWARPFGPVRIDLPFRMLQTDSAEIARRACLQLDGSWAMQEASALGRLAVRGRAWLADATWWRPLRADDVWDAGFAPDAAALRGFEPRRATLIVLEGEPDEAGLQALAEIDARAATLRCAVRVLVIQAG